MTTGAKRTWQQKLEDSKGLPRVIVKKFKTGKKTSLIPAPLQVDALMKKVPKGKLTTINEIRETLAKEYKTDITCPMTTGIFAWIAAHAADEARRAGNKRFTPYWRTLKTNGELNLKYPDGIPGLTARLRAEGHKVVRKGQRFFIANFARSLA